MPIIVPKDIPASKTLQAENIIVMNDKRAMSQDIRPLEIAIINLMPTKIVTETQLMRLLSNSPLQVNITLISTESYVGKNTPLEHLQRFYKTFAEIKNKKFDGMIITGAPVEDIDFADVTSIIAASGKAYMGMGSATGKDKAQIAANMAISSPLLEASIKGAKGVIISISASADVGLEDVDLASNMISAECDPDASVIWGVAFNPDLEDEMRITIVAAGFEGKSAEAEEEVKEEAAAPAKSGDLLDDFFGF